MPELLMSKKKMQKSDHVSIKETNQTRSRIKENGNYLLLNHQIESNQAKLRFCQSCPLVPPNPSLRPTGVTCHTCPAKIQAKLTIGQPDDKYEQEADRVSEQVINMPEPRIKNQIEPEEEPVQTKPLADKITPLAQRKTVPEEAEMDGEEKVQIQPKQMERQTPNISSYLFAQINSMKGGGQPMPRSVRNFFEPRFGYDFSRVRIHTDTRAAEITGAVDAKAFTCGQNIVFGSGQFRPKNLSGKRLLAHELTHVTQQGTKNGVERFSQATCSNQKIGVLPTISLDAVKNYVQRQSANEYTYGEIRSWAVKSVKDFAPPQDLANAKASIAAVCARGNPCKSEDGSKATAPADKAAWKNIVVATGGKDLTGGGSYMCVGHQQCRIVQKCLKCEGGRPKYVKRSIPIKPSGTSSVKGKGTLYFYKDALKGWCNKKDYISGCKT